MSVYRDYPKLAYALASWIAQPWAVCNGEVEKYVFLDSTKKGRASHLCVCLCLTTMAEACRLPLKWEEGEPGLVKAMVTTCLNQTAAKLSVRAIKAARTAPPQKGVRP